MERNCANNGEAEPQPSRWRAASGSKKSGSKNLTVPCLARPPRRHRGRACHAARQLLREGAEEGEIAKQKALFPCCFRCSHSAEFFFLYGARIRA